MGEQSATLTRAGAKQAKQSAKHSRRVSAVQQASSPRREFTAPCATAVPKSFAGIPPLAAGEKNVGASLVHSAPLLSLQCKLAIGAVNDPLEAEADAVADRVMRGRTAPQIAHSGSPVVSRKCTCEDSGKPCAACEEEKKKKILRKATGAVTPTEAPSIVHEVLRSPGQPLDAATRSFMEPRFGHDFSHVRIHTGSQAHESARAVNAHAYTVGDHIAFDHAQYNPGTDSGRRILAHELAHVVQQTDGSSQGCFRKDSGRSSFPGNKTTTEKISGTRGVLYLARQVAAPAVDMRQEGEESVRSAEERIEAIRNKLRFSRLYADKEAKAASGKPEGSRKAHRIINQATIRAALLRGRKIYEAQGSLLDPNHPLLGDLKKVYADFLGEVREAFEKSLELSSQDQKAEDEETLAYPDNLFLWLDASPLHRGALAGRTTFTPADVAAAERQETDLGPVLATIVPTLNLVKPGMMAHARQMISNTRSPVPSAGTVQSPGGLRGTKQSAADKALAQIDQASAAIDRALVLLRKAIDRLYWLQAALPPGDVADPVYELFKTRDPGYGKLLQSRLQLMQDNLQGKGSLFAHTHKPGDTSACLTPGTQGERKHAYEFVFCHFDPDVDVNAAVVLHELAHAVIPGRGSRGSATLYFPLDRAYEGERLMHRLTTEEALNNAESYSQLVQILSGKWVRKPPDDEVTGCTNTRPLLDALALAQSAHRRAWNRLEAAKDFLSNGGNSGNVLPWFRNLLHQYLGRSSNQMQEILSDFEKLHGGLSVWEEGHAFGCAIARECPADALAFDARRIFRNRATSLRPRSAIQVPKICPAFFSLGADDRARAVYVLVSLSFGEGGLKHPELVWDYASLALEIYHMDLDAPPASSLAEHQAADEAARKTGPPAPAAPSIPLQKLSIGTATDPFESEADAVADRVMRGRTAPGIAHSGSPVVSRKCGCEDSGKPSAACEEEKKKKLLRKATGVITPTAAPPIVHEVLNSHGQPLDAGTRSFMEPRFGYDFSRVRVHADARAAESARSVNADAYTVDHHVVFAAGQHNPCSNAGRRLLAHELTHVVQQQSGDPTLRRDPAPGASIDIPAIATEIETLVRPQRNDKAALEKLDSLDQKTLFLVIKKLEADAAAAFASPDTASDKAASEQEGGRRWAFATLKGHLTPPSAATQNVNVPRLKAAFDAVLYAPAAGTTASTTSTGKRGPSRGSTARPSEKEMAEKSEDKRKRWQDWLDTRDAKAREFGAADYEDYVQNMLVSGGSVFGRSIPAGHPVHPLFLDRLEAATVQAKASMPDGDFGIRAINGQDNRPGNHAWGLAVDIDADSNPYILNEAGEKKLDEKMAPIYERIAQALLHRPSIMTTAVAGKPSGLENASWDQLAEESDAMAAYFSVLKEAEAAPASTAAKQDEGGKQAAKAPPPLPARRILTGRQFDPADLQKLDIEQVKKDYTMLKGKAPEGTKGDTPFAGGGPGNWRDPARGFLSIRKEVVEALRAQGLRWGATDFPGASGDVMHFDDQNRHADYVTYGKSHPTEKRKSSGD